MNEPAPDTERAESLPVAATDARAATPAQVSDLESVARSRRLPIGMDVLLVEVAALLSSAQISVLVMCDAAGVAMGTITETVLIRCLGLGQANFFATRAVDVMTRELTSCASDDVLSDGLETMHTRGTIHLLVVDSAHRPLGVLNARDGLRTLLAAGNHEEALLRNYVAGFGYR